MLAAIVRLFALRPILTMAIMGIPVLILVAIGLFTVMALKFLVFVVLPIAIVVWLIRKLFKSGDSTT